MRGKYLLKTAVILALMFPLLGSSCPQQHAPDGADLLVAFPDYSAAPVMRVKLSEASKRATLKVLTRDGLLRLDGASRKLPGQVTINLAGGCVNVGDQSADSVEIESAVAPECFEVDGRVYRGKLRIIANKDGWEVINVVDMEQYIAGVIGWEMLRDWPVEALMAQAVASRTYALFTMQERRKSGEQWDLDDSTRFQVYGGVGPADNPRLWRESAHVLEARKATSGKVMVYKGKCFKAFFHSTSGGKTTSPDVAFGNPGSIEPLGGANLADYCKDSPRYNWTSRLGRGELNARCIENRLGINEAMKIETLEAAPSGHAITLRIYEPSGAAKNISAIEFRRVMGLPSTIFTAAREGDEWVFSGHGYGHGCGMCQWSARGMALAGWDHMRILKAMYPGSAVQTLY
ncbi:MAG: SpoIID/LytB domain-containing protein [Planctomycetes bacterium]|nr:SpoIID/LytB domain-containing protein [Planctomycetota bacterium]